MVGHHASQLVFRGSRRPHRFHDFEGCSFINVLIEVFEPGHPVRRATTFHLANIRVFVRGLAEAAGAADSDDFARKWHVLMKGSIVAAGEGDRRAARRAREVGQLLIARELDRAGLQTSVPARS